MTSREKTPEEIADELLAQEEMLRGNIVTYKVDADKLKDYSYEAIADKLNELFGVIAIDMDDGGIAEKMFLDGPLGPFITRDDKKVDIYEEAGMEDMQES